MRQTPPSGSVRDTGVDVYRDEYVAVVADPDGIVVRIVRSPVPHPSPQVLEDSYLKAALAMDRYGRKGRGLLVDVRVSIGRNEPEYEAPLRRARARNDAGFARIAVLLKSVVGMLQMMRLSDEDGTLRLVTMSEPHAIAYLRYGTVPVEARPPTSKNELKR